jgi:hypothetical protein
MRAVACRMTAMNIRLCTPSALAFVVVVGCAGHAVGSGAGGNDLSSAGGATGVGGSSSRDAAASADGAGATCPRDRSDPAGKFSAVDQRRWEANAGPDSVLITVRGGAVLSPFPPCPSRPLSCPEKDRMIALWQAENAAAQRCVRQLVCRSRRNGSAGGDISAGELFPREPHLGRDPDRGDAPGRGADRGGERGDRAAVEGRRAGVRLARVGYLRFSPIRKPSGRSGRSRAERTCERLRDGGDPCRDPAPEGV